MSLEKISTYSAMPSQIDNLDRRHQLNAKLTSGDGAGASGFYNNNHKFYAKQPRNRTTGYPSGRKRKVANKANKRQRATKKEMAERRANFTKAELEKHKASLISKSKYNNKINMRKGNVKYDNLD